MVLGFSAAGIGIPRQRRSSAVTCGFHLIWFGVVITTMGLIHPPVGSNIFVIKNIAPDIPLKDAAVSFVDL